MDAKQFSSDVEDLRSQLKRSQFANIILGVALIMALWVALNQFGRDRTIVVPPTIDKTFWVTQSTASAEHVEEMALWIAQLILNVTPDDIVFKTKTLLEYAHPEAHGELKERAKLEEARIRRDNSTSYFIPQKFDTNATDLATVVTGKLRVYINGKQVTETSKKYIVRFMIDAGRLKLTSFKEVTDNDITKILNDESEQ